MFSKIVLAAILILTLCTAARADDFDGIGWIPTWKQAQAQASKSRKPILLVAAAPQCGGVPGIW